MSTSAEYLQLVIDADRWLRYREWCETQKHEPEPDFAWIVDSDGEVECVYYSEAPTLADEHWYRNVVVPVNDGLPDEAWIYAGTSGGRLFLTRSPRERIVETLGGPIFFRPLA